MALSSPSEAGRREWRLALALFLLLLAGHVAVISIGWKNGNLPGQEFRQSQTALSALFIQRDHDFSLAYPTPVFGAPWSLPMEFPLYQWTVVKVSDLTGWPLIQTGRGVTAAGFYFALAALFPLLGRLGLSPARRLIVMGLVLSCPLYLFYSRAFLIESMALAFSLWFLVAFLRFMEAPAAGRLALVALLGVGAGLVKVTTFMVFLIPAGLWTLWLMARGRQQGLAAIARTGAWALASIAVPLAATFWWTRFADGVKMQNLSASFLRSTNLVGFNFGTTDTRFSADTLALHWKNLSHNLAGPLVLIFATMLAVTMSRRWWRQIVFCLGCYFGTLALFPTLYAWHDYYAIANAMLLLTAIGLAVAGSFDARRAWMPWALLLGLHASQYATYWSTYHQMQEAVSPGGSEMTKAIRGMTDPDEVIVAAGYDWDSSLPFYARRRALMIRSGMEHDWGYLHSAFKAQKGQPVTVFVAQGKNRENATLLGLMQQYFGIDPRPLFRWQDVIVYGRADRRGRMVNALRHEENIPYVQLDASATGEVWSASGSERKMGDLLVADQGMFVVCEPRPWKFFSEFGARLAEEAGRAVMFAHPDTRLWFRVPAGPQVLRVECVLMAAAYGTEVPERDRSDGVEFYVERETADGRRERLHSVYLNPIARPADAGFHTFEVPLNDNGDTSVVVGTGPGPNQSKARDWAAFSSITIRPATR